MSITFLIPVYNEVKTVRKAIEEAIEIEIPSKEIIIVDNGSTDGTTEIVNEYKEYNKLWRKYNVKHYGRVKDNV